MKKNINLIFLLLISCVLISCGYSTKSLLPAHLRSVHVEAFKNKIIYTTDGKRNLYFPLLEVDIHNAVIDRFLFDGNVKIGKSDTSSMTLTGELVKYYRSDLRKTDNDDVEEYRVHVVVNMELFDNVKDEIIWRENGFTGEATYFIRGPLTTTEDSAIREAVTDLARRIIERTIENW